MFKKVTLIFIIMFFASFCFSKEIPIGFKVLGTKVPPEAEEILVPEEFSEKLPVTNTKSPVWTQEELKKGYVIFTKNYLNSVFPSTKPLREEITDQLKIFSTRGEYEPVTFSICAIETIEEVKVTAGNLKGPEGKAIKACNIDVRSVRCWPQRIWKNPPVAEYEVRPWFLEKRKSIDIDKDTSQRFWITVYIPVDASAGKYTGTVKIRAKGANKSTIKLEVEVLPVKLLTPATRHGMYYHMFDETTPVQHQPYPDWYLYKDILNMKEHGMNTVSVMLYPDVDGTVKGDDVVYDLSPIEYFVETSVANGLGSGIWNTTVDPFLPAYEGPKDFGANVKGFVDGFKAKGWPLPIISYGDESDAADTWDTVKTLGIIKSRIPEVKTFTTIVFPENSEAFEPHLDIRPFSSLLDREAAKRTKEAGRELWMYSGPSEWDVKANRFYRGLWGAVLDLDGLMDWVYFTLINRGHLYDDLINPRGGPNHRGWVLPSSDGPLPTLAWEAMREGIDDSKYIFTLNTLIKKAKKSNSKELTALANCAEKYIREVYARIDTSPRANKDNSIFPVRREADKLEADFFDEFRCKLGKYIIKLEKKLSEQEQIKKETPIISGTYLRSPSYEQTRKTFKRFLELEMGNLVCMNPYGFKNAEEVMEMVKHFIENKVYFIINENPQLFTPEIVSEMEKLAGPYYLGNFSVSEIGSLVYWDRDYYNTLTPEVSWKAAIGRNKLFGATDMKDARNRYEAICRSLIENPESATGPIDEHNPRIYVGDTPVLVVDASLFQRPLLDAGCAFPCLEIIYGLGCSPERMIAGTRGAIRSVGKDRWMGYIPECYLGSQNDTLRLKRFFLSYMISYISGAEIILRESGALRDHGRVYEKAEAASAFAGYDDYDTFYNDDYKTYRDVTRKFVKFTKKDSRPSTNPKTPLGILKGKLDGFVGMWDRRVWGQIHNKPEWEYSDIEREWDYFWQFYKRRDWSDSFHLGDENLTGNPPCGQIDIVPAEACLEAWSRYKTLMFLGWNTMTPELYEKMKQYVANGGRVIVSLSHLRTNIKRSEPMELFRDGDLVDLFGVKVKGPAVKEVQGVRFVNNLSWSENGLPVWQDYKKGQYTFDPLCINGPIKLAEFEKVESRIIVAATTGFSPDPNYPIIVEKKFGKGSAVLICSWSTPGEAPMDLLMRTFIEAVSAGQCPNVKFSGSDQLRYAIYDQDDGFRIYVLNTDCDSIQGCSININGKSKKLLIEPCTLQVLEFHKGIFKKKPGLSFTRIVN